MGLLDKVKNLFTEEVEVPDTEVKEVPKAKTEEPIQKEVIKVEIPSPKAARSEIHDFAEEIDTPAQEEYKFPFFDDNDFDTIEVKKEKKEEKKPYRAEVYNPPKEEKKVFKPSPIISPVYGFLDKNYQKEDIVNKQKGEYVSKKATVDEIRDRAYGSLESDIETTLFGSNRILFDENESKEEIKEIEDEKVIDNKADLDESVMDEKPRHESLKDDDDLTELLEAEMAKTEKKKDDKKPRKISDKELFSLIDSMYDEEMK